MYKTFKMYKKSNNPQEVYCRMCQNTAFLANKDMLDLEQHLMTTKHKKNVQIERMSEKMIDVVVDEDIEKEEVVSACKATLAFHGICHNFTDVFLDCTNNLCTKLFIDSLMAEKIASDGTKMEETINKILPLYSLDKIKTGIADHDVDYIGVCADSGNYSSMKIVLIVIRYFDHCTEGLSHKLIEVKHVPNNLPETVSQVILNILKNCGWIDKCVAFGGCTFNTNFSGVGKTERNGVYSCLSSELKHLIGLRCPSNILNNCVQHAFDLWPIDIESTMIKICYHFSAFTVKTDKLREFYDYVSVNINQLSKSSKVRWLFLFPLVERVLEVYEPLKSYFLALKNGPLVLQSFFKNPFAEAYLLFVHSVVRGIHSKIKKMQSEKYSVLEIVNMMREVESSLKNKINDKFFPMTVKNILNKQHNNHDECDSFKMNCLELYKNTLEYLQLWPNQFFDYNVFQWMELKRVPEWEDVRCCCKFLLMKNVKIDDSNCFYQFPNLCYFVTEILTLETFQDKLLHEKWYEFFQVVSKPEENSEFLKICQFYFAIPVNNALIEHIFEGINDKRTEERSCEEIDLLKTRLLTKYNLKHLSCEDFFDSIIDDNELLKNVIK